MLDGSAKRNFTRHGNKKLGRQKGWNRKDRRREEVFIVHEGVYYVTPLL